MGRSRTLGMLRDVFRRSDMSDFCFSWPMLNRILRQAKLMDRMMSRLGVNPAVAVRIDRGATFYEARRRCIDCRWVGACRDWLTSSEAPPASAKFCRNAAFFEECLKRQAITPTNRH